MIIFQNNDDDYNDYRVCIILCNKIDIKKNIYLIAQSNLAREAGHTNIWHMSFGLACSGTWNKSNVYDISYRLLDSEDMYKIYRAHGFDLRRVYCQQTWSTLLNPAQLLNDLRHPSWIYCNVIYYEPWKIHIRCLFSFLFTLFIWDKESYKNTI